MRDTYTHAHTHVHAHTPMSNFQSRPGNELQDSAPWEQFWFPVMRKLSNIMPPVNFHTCFSLSIIPPIMGFQRMGGVSSKAKKTCQEQGNFLVGSYFQKMLPLLLPEFLPDNMHKAIKVRQEKCPVFFPTTILFIVFLHNQGKFPKQDHNCHHQN